MGIAIYVDHDCHQSKGYCNAVCCPLNPSDPVDMCPKIHKVRET